MVVRQQHNVREIKYGTASCV